MSDDPERLLRLALGGDSAAASALDRIISRRQDDYQIHKADRLAKLLTWLDRSMRAIPDPWTNTEQIKIRLVAETLDLPNEAGNYSIGDGDNMSSFGTVFPRGCFHEILLREFVGATVSFEVGWHGWSFSDELRAEVYSKLHRSLSLRLFYPADGGGVGWDCPLHSNGDGEWTVQGRSGYVPPILLRDLCFDFVGTAPTDETDDGWEYSIRAFITTHWKLIDREEPCLGVE